jgi:hypothetical protein
MMREFGETRSGGQRDQLLDAIAGRGAFRMFRATLKRLGIEPEWNRFRESRFESIARRWLEENSIPYSET